MTIPTTKQRLTGRVVDVTSNLQEITAEVERRPDDPRVLAILSEMESRMERAVSGAIEQIRRLDDHQEGKLS